MILLSFKSFHEIKKIHFIKQSVHLPVSCRGILEIHLLRWWVGPVFDHLCVALDSEITYKFIGYVKFLPPLVYLPTLPSITSHQIEFLCFCNHSRTQTWITKGKVETHPCMSHILFLTGLKQACIKESQW